MRLRSSSVPCRSSRARSIVVADATSSFPDDLVSISSCTPPVPHSRPALLQAVLTLPPSSTLHLTMDVVKPFLRYTEHQPDAQRGWDLPPAVLVPFSFGGEANLTAHGQDTTALAGRRRPRRMYTPVLLVDLATPDFSMPYNVIIMSCTLIALIFGSIFNLLTRRFVIVRLGPAPEAPAQADRGHEAAQAKDEQER